MGRKALSPFESEWIVALLAVGRGARLRKKDGNLILFGAGNHADLANKVEAVLRETELVSQIRENQNDYARRETWKLAAERTTENYRYTTRLH